MNAILDKLAAIINNLLGDEIEYDKSTESDEYLDNSHWDEIL
jgi:hypothetical protein